MTTKTEPETIARSVEGESDLVRRTLRTVGLLVLACVIFVGALSAAAVAIASRAVSAGTTAPAAHDANETAKKPLSI